MSTNSILIQAATDADRELLEITRAHHRWYAWRHGMEYLCVPSNPAAPKRPGWAKIPLLLLAIQMGFRRLVWLDADAVIFDARVDLSQLVDTGIGMVRHPGPDHFSTGMIAVAATQEAFLFLQKLHAMPDNDHPWAERLAVNTLAARPEYAGVISRLAPAYNSVPGGATSATPVVMAAYGLPPETKRDYLTRWLKDAPLREHSQGGTIVPEIHLRTDFGEFLNRRGLVGEAAEIGVQQGLFSRCLLDRWQGSMLHLIDPWRKFDDGYVDIANVSNDQHEAFLREALRNLQPHQGRYRVHRELSQEAVSSFADNSLDFVYIDANHEYQAVLEDIRAWFSKVKPGGVLAGHDYLDGVLPAGHFGVKSAVRAFECETGLLALGTLDPAWPSWYLIKPTA
jgi:Methyltransferase domain